MIEGMKRQSESCEVFRLGNLSNVAKFGEREGLNVEEVKEIAAFMGDEFVNELIDDPFKPKSLRGSKYQFGFATRFSDGSWPVFYATLEEATATIEVSHHYEKKSKCHYAANAAGQSANPRDVYYSLVHCKFSGETIDLRPKLVEWPNLVSDDYRFCHGLGEEASKTMLDAFLGPSARNEGGTTVPVFRSDGLSDHQIRNTKRFRFDVSTMNAVVETIDG